MMNDKRVLTKGLNNCTVLLVGFFVFFHICSGALAENPPLRIRLVNGVSRNQGYVQVNVQNQWGTICGYYFGNKEATVLCRMLGYYGGGLNDAHLVGPLQGLGPNLIHGLDCYGNETSITECNRTKYCNFYSPRTVTCMSVSDVRLRDGKRDSEGRLEVFYEGEWGSVCGNVNDFGEKDGLVACRMLGYKGDDVIIRRNAYYGLGPNNIWVEYLRCTGNETSLFTCPGSLSWVQTRCFDNNNVGLDCLPALEPKLPVRLVGGNHSYEGRVEIFYNETWGAVCIDDYNHDWDQNAARVVCNQLNLTNTAMIPTDGNYYGANSSKLWLSDVKCTGRERDLGQCGHMPLGQFRSCNPVTPRRAGVMCVPESMQRTLIRLRNGKRKSQGRLEVFYQGKWGTVCQQNFNQREASVVCRMLGYSGRFAEMRRNVYFGAGLFWNDIWLGNITCIGNETSLFNCQMNPFGHSGCFRHSYDVGVDCEPWMKLYLGIRLVNGTTPRSGQVEVHHNSTWATVCDKSWGVKEAEVACNQLGFLHSIPVAVRGAYYGTGTGNILIDGLQCNGTEANIGYCAKRPLGFNNCSHTEDAGLMCLQKNIGTAETVNVRLVNGAHPNQGRVEVQFRHIWGTVCGASFDDEAATVVCRQLGFSGGRRFASVGPGQGPVWIDAPACKGTETTVADCQFKGWGNNTCNHSQDVAVSCDQIGGVIG